MTQRVSDSEDVREVLEECISRATTVYVTCAERGIVFEGTLAGILDEELIVDLAHTNTTSVSEVMVPTTQVVLSFTFEQKSRCCLTNARRILDATRELEGTGERVVLALPKGCATATGRLLYRVDTSVIEGFECMIGVRDSSGGGILHAQVMNISDSGVYVTFARGVPDLDEHDAVAITLSFDGKRVTIDGAVRRRDEEGIAFYFPVVVEHPSLDSPPELRALVHALERAWLSHRVRTSGYGYD